MHIHSVIISFNRPELTEQAIRTYVEATTVPFSLLVMDNGSSQETIDRLSPLIRSYILDADVAMCLLGENRFPGYATNRGWEQAPPEATHLHRGDNDFAYLPGWCEEVLARFEDSNIGQVGLRTDQEEMFNTHNVGGNNVIARKLWDAGLRYDERPWGNSKWPVGYTEDSFFSPAVAKRGYRWTRVQKPCIVSLAAEDPTDPYYQETWRLRGITPPKESSD